MPNIEVNGIRFYYEDQGEGNVPLILIHGAVGSSAQYTSVIEALSSSRRVVAPDLRGMGRTEHVSSIYHTAWVDDMLALVEALEIERYDVCGSSLGARIAMRMALQAPDRVRSLVLDASILRNEAPGNAAMNRMLDFANMTEEFRARMQGLHGDDWADVVQFFGQARAMPELQSYLNLTNDVATITQPTLFTRGDIDDDSHPIAHSIQAMKSKPGSWLWIAPNSTFSAIRERPTEFRSIFEEFIKAHG